MVNKKDLPPGAYEWVENLFDFESVYLYARNHWYFVNVTLKRDFGAFKKGATVAQANIEGVRLYLSNDPNDHRWHAENEFMLKFA